MSGMNQAKVGTSRRSALDKIYRERKIELRLFSCTAMGDGRNNDV